MRAILAILASVSICSQVLASSDDDSSLDNFLYDISNDPTEDKNLFDDDGYDDIKSTFEERLDYWSGLVQSAEVPDWSDADTAFAELGGVGAWLTSDYEPIKVPHLYDYEHAPNIVFVLVDDWGWNDIGLRSTYLSWATPTIDRLAQEGVRLNNHYSHELCVPSRGALMTGRYPLRLGLWDHANEQSAVLRLNESTIAQELQSAGYRTYMVGKWDLGYAATQYYPTKRGFDSFYGYYTSQIDYWSKNAVSSSDIDGSDDDASTQYLDLHTGDELVKDKLELSSDYHSAALFEEKAEDAIKDWYENYSKQPFFLYYALQLVHTPYEAPARFLERCDSSGSDDTRYQTYCAMNVMLDEVIANLTCTLEHFGMSDDTILIIASDNGGSSEIPGDNYPFRGAKGDYWRGGVSTTALIHSKLLPDDALGLEYNGNVHITDWLPTIMGLATNQQWKGALSGLPIDGEDMWDAITSNDTSSQRYEIVFYAYDDTEAALQLGNYRYYKNVVQTDVSDPDYVFDKDEDSSLSYELCSDPSLIDYSSSSTLFYLLADSLGLGKPFTSEGKLSVLVNSMVSVPLLVVIAAVGVAFARRRRQQTAAAGEEEKRRKQGGYTSLPVADH